MKIPIAFGLILLTLTCFSQQITSQDLIGKWVILDSTGSAGGEVSFTDSRTVTIVAGSVAKPNCAYTIDASAGDFAILTIGTNYNNMLRPMAKFLLKKVDNDRYKMQGSLENQNIEDWELPETRSNTGFLVRKK
jgi:hypothetical protein